jgi:hypothetical protein
MYVNTSNIDYSQVKRVRKRILLAKTAVKILNILKKRKKKKKIPAQQKRDG